MAILDIVALAAGVIVIVQGVLWLKDRWSGRR
jgi:hypothetical protein